MKMILKQNSGSDIYFGQNNVVDNLKLSIHFLNIPLF